MRFATKRDLVEQIESEQCGFVELAGSIPRKRVQEEGVRGENWTIKDLFAHLTAWEQMFRGWYR